jgi:SET family sugar efflux transporter-like MFS transporter
MNKKQLISLFVCSLVPWTVGNGLVPLLPVYAITLGADQSAAGNYLAFSYIALALGAVSAGWVSDRLGLRKISIIFSGLVGIPTAFFLGRVESIWSLTLLTALLWFCGGLGLALMGILTGMSAREDQRGKIFGILSLTGGLGALTGGLAAGALVDRWGYPTLFSATAIFLVLWPLSGLFLTEAKTTRVNREEGDVTAKPQLGRSYYHLFSASLVASIAAFVIVLGRSLRMGDLAFNATDISLTGAVSGIISMPLPLLMGWLSDRTGRKVYLILAYLAASSSLAILAVSSSLWHFATVMALQAFFTGVNGSVGNALVTDLLPQEALGKGLSLFGATSWIGGVLGFAGAGYAMQNLGMLPTFIIGGCLPLVGILLLVPVRGPKTWLAPEEGD